MSSTTVKIISDSLTEDYVVLIPRESTETRKAALTSNTELQSLYFDYSLTGYYPPLRIASGVNSDGQTVSVLGAGDSLTVTLYDSADKDLSANSASNTFSIIIAEKNSYKPIAFALAVINSSNAYNDITISSNNVAGMAGALKFMKNIMSNPSGTVAVSYNLALKKVLNNYSTDSSETNYIGKEANLNSYIDEYYEAVTTVLSGTGMADYDHTEPMEILAAQSYLYHFPLAWLPNDLDSSLIYSLKDSDGVLKGSVLIEVADSTTGIDITQDNDLYGISMTYYGADIDMSDTAAVKSATGTELGYGLGVFTDTDYTVRLCGNFLYSQQTYAKYLHGTVDGITCGGTALDYSVFSDATDSDSDTDETEAELIEDFHKLEVVVWIGGIIAVAGFAIVTIGTVNNIVNMSSRATWRYKFNKANKARVNNGEEALTEEAYSKTNPAPKFDFIESVGDFFGRAASGIANALNAQTAAQNNINNNAGENMILTLEQTAPYRKSLGLDLQYALDHSISVVDSQKDFNAEFEENLSMNGLNNVNFQVHGKNLYNVQTNDENSLEIEIPVLNVSRSASLTAPVFKNSQNFRDSFSDLNDASAEIINTIGIQGVEITEFVANSLAVMSSTINNGTENSEEEIDDMDDVLLSDM